MQDEADEFVEAVTALDTSGWAAGRIARICAWFHEDDLTGYVLQSDWWEGNG